jgi:hypothetical protein
MNATKKRPLNLLIGPLILALIHIGFYLGEMLFYVLQNSEMFNNAEHNIFFVQFKFKFIFKARFVSNFGLFPWIHIFGRLHYCVNHNWPLCLYMDYTQG